MTQVKPFWGTTEEPRPKGEHKVEENLRMSLLDSVLEKVKTKLDES